MNWKTYFNFNRAERNGVLVLCVLILLIFLIPEVSRHYKKARAVNFVQFQKELVAFEKEIAEKLHTDSAKHHDIDFQNVDRSIAEQKITPFYFNPNNLPVEEWKKMGLKDWQIKIIKNYESKGGKFFRKEDVKKMYGITETEYAILEPYIVFPDREKTTYTKTEFEKRTESKTLLWIDINTADTLELTKLKGIGAAFARRIVKYREALGGFYTKEQLKEVYGFDEEKYSQCQANCIISDNSNLKKINLNTATLEQLKKHPYIDYYTAKAIIDYRIINKKFNTIGELKNILLIHSDLYNKLLPYVLANQP